ncbi:MAG: ABC transporter ATP-binding protein [Chloroflexi bacterium]|nr:MAG: ABC transporter ATP-binding protein [Chloroflexota bacterium]
MKTAVRLLRPYLGAHRSRRALALAAMIGEIATALLMPVPIQRAIDLLVSAFRHAGSHARTATLSPSQYEQLILLTVALLVIALLDALFTYLDSSNSARVGQTVVTDLRRALYNHIQRLSLSFHHSTETRGGDLQLRLSGDVANLQVLISTVAGSFVTNAGTAVFMLGALLLLDRRLGAIVIAGSIPVYLLSRHYRIKIRTAVRAARKQDGRVSAMLAETLSAAPLVQVLGREEHEAERLVDATEEGLSYGIQASEAQARVQPAVTLVTSAVTALTLLVAALLVIRGSLSIGLLTLALAYTRGTFSSMRQLAKLPIQVQRAAVSAERLAEVFGFAPDVRDPVRPRPIPPGPLSVEFDSVTFGYTPGRPVLKDFSWLVEPGSVVALVGRTGAGRSSALALVPRLYDVWEGAVRLGGRDVRDVRMADLRSSVTLVLQESLLFRNTVWNNIAYGRPDAAKDDIMAAAEAAGVLTFVDELKGGFETIVSERGSTLSGGQKQCIALARAMLRRAPVVIMDEPTSSMDAATEQLVIRGIGSLIEGRTAVVIAHRLSTIRGADVVAVMEDGRLVQFGPPAQLLKQQGLFAYLSHIQQAPAERTAQ